MLEDLCRRPLAFCMTRQLFSGHVLGRTGNGSVQAL
jgi:hypothetical protein